MQIIQKGSSFCRSCHLKQVVFGPNVRMHVRVCLHGTAIALASKHCLLTATSFRFKLAEALGAFKKWNLYVVEF